MNSFFDIISPYVNAVILAILAWMVKKLTDTFDKKQEQRDKVTEDYKKLREEKEAERDAKIDALLDADRDNMRNDLYRNYRDSIRQGYYPASARLVYHSLYERYKSSPYNGNHGMDKLAEEIILLPYGPEDFVDEHGIPLPPERRYKEEE